MMTAIAKKPTPQPKYQPSTDPAKLQTQIANLQKEVDRRGGAAKAPQFAARLKQAQSALGTAQNNNPNTPPNVQNPTPTQGGFNQAGNAISGGIESTIGQIQNQGAFNPGSFADQQNAAYQHVMDQFNRTNQPQFQQQANDFRQRMAEQGIDPNSKEYNQAYQNQILNPQQQQTQNAEDSAYGQGLAAQQQGYTQASNTYQMPFQQLQALSQPYSTLGSNLNTNQTLAFQGGQNALDRQQQMAVAAQQQRYAMQQLQFQAAHRSGGGGGGGGGGIDLNGQMALQNNNFFNQMALLAAQGGQQNPNPTAGSGFATGVGAGIGAGITGALTR
jgi:hypothetical protein